MPKFYPFQFYPKFPFQFQTIQELPRITTNFLKKLIFLIFLIFFILLFELVNYVRRDNVQFRWIFWFQDALHNLVNFYFKTQNKLNDSIQFFYLVLLLIHVRARDPRFFNQVNLIQISFYLFHLVQNQHFLVLFLIN